MNEVVSLIKEIEKSDEILKQLKNNQMVIEYIEEVTRNEKLKKEYEKLWSEYHEKCEHEILYKVSEDIPEDKKCKCLSCGLEIEKVKSTYKGFIVDTDKTYEETKEVHDRFLQATDSPKTHYMLISKKLK